MLDQAKLLVRNARRVRRRLIHSRDPLFTLEVFLLSVGDGLAMAGGQRAFSEFPQPAPWGHTRSD
jgi:hypothetical protein